MSQEKETKSKNAAEPGDEKDGLDIATAEIEIAQAVFSMANELLDKESAYNHSPKMKKIIGEAMVKAFDVASYHVDVLYNLLPPESKSL